MAFFADMVINDGHMAFEKCGDVVVSTKDNKLALFCHFCKDLITYLPQFLRHLHEAHGDVLHFKNDHNVYSVEELLSGAAEEDREAEDVENNSQDENCGMPQVAEEPDECVKSKNIPDETEKESPGSTTDVLAEVEAMLFSDEDDEKESEKNSQQDMAIKAYLEVCQGLQKKKEVTKEPLISKPEPDSQRSKGGRNQKGLNISRLRSHAIARQSRKRMSTVKKRILRAIDNFVPKNQIPLKNNPADQDKAADQAQLLQLAPIRPRIPLSKTPARPPMNAGHLSVRKSTLTTARISLQMTTTTTTSSATVVSCSKEEEPSYQASQSVVQSSITEQENSCQENQMFNLGNICGTQKSPIEIQKIEMLPKLETQNDILNNAENVDDIDIEKELAVLLGQPMRWNSKETKESPAKVINSRTKIQKLNKDVKSYNQTQLNTKNVENKLEIILAGIDLLNKTPTKQDSTSADVNESIEVLIDNCTLLKYVGLPVIHNPSYEDKIMLDELEDLRGKAAKFCEIFRKYDEIWNCRRTKPMANNTKKLADLIELLTQDVIAELDCYLSKSDAKRILNLITLWFRQTIDLKHFKKVPLSPSIQYYFNLFAFIPKLTRFLFFCEYCDENFTLEAAYRKHLLSHSFTIRCAICHRPFKRHGFLDKHLRAHHANDNVLDYI
ncbi:protein teflon isoform X2 [Drosophila serrata]|uniref:protein teflon isoform X2 n=1 Tax=Drosophila serrata TaxID=7274 RepID=UPI000A1D2798|nr:protein teflon isoform X2 [Drosophila serrata]